MSGRGQLMYMVSQGRTSGLWRIRVYQVLPDELDPQVVYETAFEFKSRDAAVEHLHETEYGGVEEASLPLVLAAKGGLV